MKQVIEQVELPDLSQLDLGDPFEFSGELFYGSEGQVKAEARVFLSKLGMRGVKIGYYRLSDCNSRYANEEFVVWVGGEGDDKPTENDIIVELEGRLLVNVQQHGE